MTRKVLLTGGEFDGRVFVIGMHCVAMHFPLRSAEPLVYKPAAPARLIEGAEVWALVQPQGATA
jgi:hypothetical protein